MRILLLLITLIVCLLSSCSTRDENRIYTKFDPVSLKKDFESFRQIIKYAHPGKYFHCSPKELDKLFDSVENTLDKDHTEIEFYQKLAIITKKIACVHTNLSLSKVLGDSLTHQEILFPIPLICIGNKLYVNSNETDLPLAAEIIKINNQSAEQILNKIESVNVSDGFSKGYAQNQIATAFYYDYYITNGPQKEFTVSLKAHPDSLQRVQKIKAKNLDDITGNYRQKWFEYNNATDFDLEFLNEKKAAILTLRSFHFAGNGKQGPYNHFLENTFRLLHLSNTKNLIIDIRDNGGGNYSNTMLTYSYLGKRNLNICKKAWMIFDEVPYLAQISDEDLYEANIVDEVRKAEFNTKLKSTYFFDSLQNDLYEVKKENHFDGNLYIITNANTVSCGAYFASLLKDEARAVIVGSETGGGATQHSGFKDLTYTLPNTKIKLSFSVTAVIHNLENQKQNVHRGVIPDYYKTISQSDFIDNTDTEINFILDSLINKN